MGLTVEQQVLKFLQDANRPYNVQLVVDMLQKFGIKKGQVTKALDCLVEKEVISVKEFGKVKIFFPVQDSSKVLPKEELDARRAHISDAGKEIQEISSEVESLKKELVALKSQKTLAEMEKEAKEVAEEVVELEGVVSKLSEEMPESISKEEQTQQLKRFHDYMAAWRKRRGIFNTVWDTLSENLEGKTRDLFEEIGIENDEAAGCKYRGFEQLVQSCKRRRM